MFHFYFPLSGFFSGVCLSQAGAARYYSLAHGSLIISQMIVFFFNNPGLKCGYFPVKVKLISLDKTACS
jgi:hypothetical protein